MADKKKVWFVLPVMKGGGAERVASILANEFSDHGFDMSFLLTQSKKEEVINRDLKPEIPLIFLSDMISGAPKISRVRKIISSALSHLYENADKPVPASLARFSFVTLYREGINAMHRMMAEQPDATVIAFLQPSIPIVLLAAEGLPNRVIISERADPNRLMKKRYGRKFIEAYYPRADAAVFQTNDAKNAYPPCVSDKGTVICNPIKSDLPEPYTGERNHNITTFCRISAQKNLPLLFEAFKRLHDDHPDYILRVIGDAANDEGQAVKKQLDTFISDNRLQDAVTFEPFNANVHDAILQDAMYVNSSDYEGISNAMLEAMAIGLPVVCTDCPIGGANATIRDGENGLLVPVGDSEALYRAMKRVIEEPGLADRLSRNAVSLREELKLENIARKWMELL